MAVLPSPDSATEEPCWAFPTAPLPTSLFPCWLHTPPLRVNTHAAPTAPAVVKQPAGEALSHGPPTMAVLPSPDSATETPWSTSEGPTAPVPTSLFPCWVHTPPLRVNTHTAPALPLSYGPPTMAVLPSPDSATERPCPTCPAPPPPTS